jgi:hypothetical protein
MQYARYLIVATMIMTLFSCLNRKSEPKNDNLIIGSSIENINSSQYTGFKFNIENEVCLATINQYFKGYKYKSQFPYSLWITVETKYKNENGHPTGEEAALFNNLEDSIISKLDRKTPYCFIGRTTRNGYREIMFYVSDKEKAAELLNEFVNEDRFKRKIDFNIGLDKTWESVSGFLE